MKKISFLTICTLFLAFLGCSDSSVSSLEGDEASAEKQFVWNAMNSWYFWQAEVPELADDRFSGEQDFFDFLNGFPNEEDLFNSLLFREDDFSFFIEDFEQFQQSQQGISRSFGFSFQLFRIENTNDLFGFVQYVVPDTPADKAGLKRGDLFTGINGVLLRVSNFQELLGNDSYTLTLAKMENGAISETGETVSMDAEVLQENPVFMTEIFEAGSSKVGYMVYNAFRFNFHKELNDAFGFFQNEQIDELVLDLRYNSGGAVLTSALLAGMISGIETGSGNNFIFSSLIFNDKKSGENSNFPFFDEVPLFNENREFDTAIPMNRLSLNRVYVLTGQRTASASEVLINGLKPFLDVIQIGVQTRGKDEGSITLLDAPGADYNPDNDQRNLINPNHKRAVQPIVFKIFNNNLEDFPNGFLPDFPLNELDFLDNLPPLGDPSDPLLAKALDIIGGTDELAKMQIVELPHTTLIFDSRDLQPFEKEMYLLPYDLREILKVTPNVTPER